MELPGDDFTLDVNRIIVGKSHFTESRETSFFGNLRNFYFDGERLFDRYPSDAPVDFTRPPPPTEPPVLTVTNPITFPPGFVHHIRVSLIQISSDSRIRFMFRTHDGNGLLLYTARPGGSFLGVELIDGQVGVCRSNNNSCLFIYLFYLFIYFFCAPGTQFPRAEKLRKGIERV